MTTLPNRPNTALIVIDVQNAVVDGTPNRDDVIANLNTAVAVALADSTVRQRLADLGQDVPLPEQQTPEALGAFHKSEIEKWWPIIKAAGIKVD